MLALLEEHVTQLIIMSFDSTGMQDQGMPIIELSKCCSRRKLMPNFFFFHSNLTFYAVHLEIDKTYDVDRVVHRQATTIYFYSSQPTTIRKSLHWL